jgi:hypothetical protein
MDSSNSQRSFCSAYSPPSHLPVRVSSMTITTAAGSAMQRTCAAQNPISTFKLFPGVPMLFPRCCSLRLDHWLVGSTHNRRTACGFDPTYFRDRTIAFCGQSQLRLHSNALRRSHFWHHYLDCTIFECRLGLRKINLSGQIDNAEHKLSGPERMGLLFRFVVFAGLGFSTDAQPMRFKTHLDLPPVESRNFGACPQLFARLRKVELHRV